jgi:hypothetical protein
MNECRTDSHPLSLDQTTRIHGPWKRLSQTSASPNDIIETWHEISRPQIHGYDLITPSFLGSLRFASAADEKVARVFDAPKGFVQTLKALRTVANDGIDLDEVSLS